MPPIRDVPYMTGQYVRARSRLFMIFNSRAMAGDLGLLLLRLSMGGTMVIQHGWPKLSGFADRMDKFSDPLGISAPVSLALIVFAEFFCAVLVVLGLWTRAAVIPLLMLAQEQDGWVTKRAIETIADMLGMPRLASSAATSGRAGTWTQPARTGSSLTAMWCRTPYIR